MFWQEFLILSGLAIVSFHVGPTSAKVVIFDLNAYYFDASPDGVKKQVLGVNGSFPGPTIRATRNDTLVVRITNSIKDKDGVTFPTSVHWHGIEMHFDPWYDGPEGVSQCPIPYNQSMEYRFKLYEAGTYWYHSHHNWQYVEGFWGMLIVDNMPNEMYPYDEELHIALNDWYHTPAKILSAKYHSQEINIPPADSGLINGRGTYPCPVAQNGLTCDPTKQSPALLTVTPGKTYRIRIVNTAARSNFNFSIDGHRFEVIEIDGVDTVKVGPVDVVEVWPAQRYSLLVTMSGDLDEYWIRAVMSGLNATTPGVEYPKAILKYEREVCSEPSTLSEGIFTPGPQGRPEIFEFDWSSPAAISSVINDKPGSDFVFPLSTPPIDTEAGQRADEKHRLALASVRLPVTVPNPSPVDLDPNLCRPISRDAPSAPGYSNQTVTLNALLPNRTGVGEPRVGLINGVAYSVHSPPVIMRMKRNLPIDSTTNAQFITTLGMVVQLVVNNRNGAAHPWHLHGHTFWVLGTGRPNETDYNESLHGHRLNVNGMRRDTTPTPANSWLVVRFVTDNPGAWLFHCHINWHLEIGLGAVFIEGLEELRDKLELPAEADRICALYDEK